MVVVINRTVVTLLVGVGAAGGWAEVFRAAQDSGRLNGFNDFDPDPTTRHSFWTLTIGGTVTWFALHGINQAQLQRYFSLSSVHKARMAVLIGLPGFILINTLCCLLGLTMYAYYREWRRINIRSFRWTPTVADQNRPLAKVKMHNSHVKLYHATHRKLLSYCFEIIGC